MRSICPETERAALIKCVFCLNLNIKVRSDHKSNIYSGNCINLLRNMRRRRGAHEIIHYICIKNEYHVILSY